MALVISPGVGYSERLEDAADRLAGPGPRRAVEVVGHQAVAGEAEGVPLLRLGEGLEEGEVVVVIGEGGGAVVAAAEGVIDQAIVDRSP